MSSYRLEQLKRKLKVPAEQAEQPAAQDNSALGDAIQVLIQKEVERQSQQQPKQPAAERLQNVDRQLSEHANNIVPDHLKPFGAKPSTDWPAPSKTTPFPKAPMVVELIKDKAGKTIGTRVGDKEFRVERDSAGKVKRMVELT